MKLRSYFFPSILLLVLSCYYFYFANKGSVFSDEGVYTFTSELISKGKIPYQDFFLEYPPLYFYLLAGLYKIFGVQIIVGRILSLVFCLGICATAFAVVKKFALHTKKDLLVTFFCIASFGYPLINIPILTWPSVLITLFLMLTLLSYSQKKKVKIFLVLGLLLALQIALKQNLALTETILVNIIILFGYKMQRKEKLLLLVFMNLVWTSITFGWVYIFFLHNNIDALKEFIAFSLRLGKIYPFTYPPLSNIFEPLGFIKILPYYLPIGLLGAIGFQIFRKKNDLRIFVLMFPLCGFFTTIYPVSEVLHVYPYYGLVLLTLYIFYKLYVKKFSFVIYTLLLISFASGMYMIHFRGHYRYHAPYSLNNTLLNLPKSHNIYIDQTDAINITKVYNFIQTHTKSSDPIFAYPFSPMQYFLFDRPNPARYPIYAEGYLTIEEENNTLRAINQKHTKYVITDGDMPPHRPLSTWINKQKYIIIYGQYKIYKIGE